MRPDMQQNPSWTDVLKRIFRFSICYFEIALRKDLIPDKREWNLIVVWL